MKKHWWLALILVFAFAIPAIASQAIKIYVNGEEVKSDVPAQIINGRTMVPIRAVSEFIGKKVFWDASTKSVSIEGTNLDLIVAITNEWAAEKHADTSDEVLGHAGLNDGCQPCHSGQGIMRELSDKPYRPVKDTPEGGHAENAQTIGCPTCHTGTGQNMIDTGITPASLSRFSAADLKAPGSALCIACHNGRRDTKALYAKAASGTIDASYPHHATGALVSGKGGMEYPGVTYASSAGHLSVGCVGCHMPKTADGYKSHDFTMNKDYLKQTCGTCHPGATDYTMGGNLKAEMTKKLDELQKLAVAKVPGAVKIGGTRQTFPFEDAAGKRVDVKTVPLEAYVAAYNYYMLKEDLDRYSAGAHNPAYTRALLNESIKKLQ